MTDCRELALKKVKINGNVIGKFGNFEIEQTFLNNTNKVLEVSYLFPIVESATVNGFEVHVCDKVLKGKCQETKKAKKEYQKNMVKGNSAYMMEENTKNAFKISVGKIDKNEEVTIKIFYLDKFDIVDNQINVHIPTLVTPKYNSDVTSGQSYGKVDYTVDFNINIAKNLKVEQISSPSHNLNILDNGDCQKVEVLNHIVSKDFKLYITLKNELCSTGLITSKENSDYVYLSFMPEIFDTYEDSEKEYIFLIDVSGSMSGKKLEETKCAVIECLKQIDEGDKFNIVAFESDFEAMSIKPLDCNEENINKAINYVKSLDDRGGTEILNPIKFALYEQDSEKMILLFTDGQVGNEDEILDFVHDNINKSRIFPFGIDYDVNTSFINDLAKIGNGKAELITPDEKIDDKIIRTFSRIQTPLLENLEIDYGQNKLVDEIREDNCLFNYEFFNVLCQVEKLVDDIKLKGFIEGKEYSWTISKDTIKNVAIDLETLLAKLQIDRLEDYIVATDDSDKIENYKEMIIELAEKYNINSKYTSFLSVYERENKLLDVPEQQITTLNTPEYFEDVVCADANLDYYDSGIYFEDSNLGEFLDCTDNSSKTTCLNSLKRSSNANIQLYDCCFNEMHCYITKIRKNKNFINFIIDNYETIVNECKKTPVRFLLLTLCIYGNTNNLTEICLNNGLEFISEKEVIEYLKNNRDTISTDETCNKLLYWMFTNSHCRFKNSLVEFMDKDYQKIIATEIKVNVKSNVFEAYSKSEIDGLIARKTVFDNLDRVLWTLGIDSGILI